MSIFYEIEFAKYILPYLTLYLPAYMASQLLWTGVLVLSKMIVQIRQHFQAAVNEVYQIHHVFNAILAANPVGIQRPEGLLFIVVGFDGPTQLVQLQRIIVHAFCRRVP